MASKKAVLWIITIMLLAGGTPAAAAGTKKASMDAKWIDGELFVKASAVVSALGADGEYDAESGTFTLTQPNRVAEVVKTASPAIVAIIGKPEGEGRSASLDDRYNLAHGTGFVVEEDGWIITNAHVVKGMKKLVVVTSEGKQYEAKAPYVDEDSDLAMVKIEAKGLTVIPLANTADVEVGDSVVAIGTPISFALRNSASAGIISGVNRAVHSTYKLLQTDAAINPGNSGGPLMNMKGEVIGVNSLKFAAVGVESLGFSIPVDTVRYVMDQFHRFGRVKRPVLGFEVEESWAAVVGLPTDEPMTVKRVERGSAADKLGIQAGDILYSVDGVNVKSEIDLNEFLKAYLPGDKVKLTLLSQGDLVNRTITLAEAVTDH
ncbi:S1C family serine protease [Gorillibacterium sp. sgz5001074]|uniref:S1C family serine protease n=1 Tax=Gorillibacterium sp. sgz5001074 TaxID=3446695 RepID=UPI003F66EE9C